MQPIVGIGFDQSDQHRGIPDRQGGRRKDGVGHGFDDPDPFAVRQNGGRERDSRPSGLIEHSLNCALRCPKQARQIRKIVPPVGRPAQIGAEFPAAVGMDEVVAFAADDVDTSAWPHRSGQAEIGPS